MHGQLWLSLFRVREGDHPDREPGVYGAALVSYERPSPLTYSELLGGPPGREEGHHHRHLGGLGGLARRRPRAVGDPQGPVRLQPRHRGPCAAHAWQTALEGTPIASASFTDVSNATLRTPFKGATRQERESRRRRPRAPHRQRQVAAPARASWDVHTRGPAGLAGRQAVDSRRSGWPTFRCPSADRHFAGDHVVVGARPAGGLADLEQLGGEATDRTADVADGADDDRGHGPDRVRRAVKVSCTASLRISARLSLSSAHGSSLPQHRRLTRPGADVRPGSGSDLRRPGSASRQILLATLNSCLRSGPVVYSSP